MVQWILVEYSLAALEQQNNKTKHRSSETINNRIIEQNIVPVRQSTIELLNNTLFKWDYQVIGDPVFYPDFHRTLFHDHDQQKNRKTKHRSSEKIKSVSRK